MIRGETACPAFSSYSVGSHFCRAFPETLGTLGFRNPSVFSSRLSPETSQTAAGQSWSPDGKKLINSGSYLNLPRLPGSRKGGEREKFYLLRGKNRAGMEEICHALMDNFCEPRKPVPFKTSGNTLRCCLCPLKIFSRCRGAFHPFRATAGNVKNSGKTENPFRMKKRLPNLPSAVILSLLSYLAQSPTGRCQSGRMSTPGKCVYRKPVPRVRIPPLSAINFSPQYIRNEHIAVFACRGMGEKWGN